MTEGPDDVSKTTSRPHISRIAELRKSVGQASVQHPRLSLAGYDYEAYKCGKLRGGAHRTYTFEPDGTLREDFSRAPKLVPLVLLGCQAAVKLLTEGDACTGATFLTFKLSGLVDGHGGPHLAGVALT